MQNASPHAFTKPFGMPKGFALAMEYHDLHRTLHRSRGFRFSSERPALRIARLCAALLYLGIGIFFLTKLNFDDPWQLLLYGSAAAVSLWGCAAVLRLGMLRGLLSTLLASLCIVFVRMMYQYMLRSGAEGDFSFYLLSYLCFGLLICVAEVFLFRFFCRASWDHTVLSAEDGSTVSVDLPLIFTLQPLLFPVLYRVNLPLRTNESDGTQTLRRAQHLQQFCMDHNLLFVGSRLNMHQHTASYYIYAKERHRHDKSLYRFFRQWQSGEPTLMRLQDRQWSIYKAELFPSVSRLSALFNQTVTTLLERWNYDFSMEEAVAYINLFHTAQDAAQFLEAAQTEGYRVYGDLRRSHWMQEELYLTIVTEITRLGEERMTMNMRRITALGERFGGDIQGWYRLEDVQQQDQQFGEPVQR